MLAATVFSRQQRSFRPVILLAEAALVWLAFESAYASRSALPFERAFYLTNPIRLSLLVVSVAVWPLIGRWLGAYDRLVWEPRAITLVRSIKQAAWLIVVLVLFQYFQRLDISRPFLALFSLYCAVLTAVFRLSVDLLARRFWNRLALPLHIYIAGTGASALRIAALIRQSAEFGLRLDGFLSDQAAPQGAEPATLDGCSVYHVDAFPELLKSAVVDELIVASDRPHSPAVEELLLICEEEGVRIRLCLDFVPHTRAAVSLERLGTTPLLTLSRTPSDEALLAVKRLLDMLLAALSLLILAPLMAVVCLLVRLSSPGPVIFRQIRCGLNGRRFTVLKFRTMVDGAEQRLLDIAHLNVKSVHFKIPNDPRLTGIGRWLRRFSLDELPQLWNVLRGEMSLVGPRPALPSEVEQYRRWQRRRLRMRPGLTCLQAVEGRDAIGFDEAMELDLAYIDSWSLGLDWSIILRTVPRVLTGEGAH